jgi:hypothetical protein
MIAKMDSNSFGPSARQMKFNFKGMIIVYRHVVLGTIFGRFQPK